ncbi:MAG: hypothetical protein AAF998_04515 [Bacteroidota bacterium]
MKNQSTPRLPAADRRAMSMTKAQRLLHEISRTRKTVAYYRTYWAVSLAGGLGGLLVLFVWLLLGYRISLYYLLVGVLATANGFYWLYKYLTEGRKLEKMENVARKHGLEPKTATRKG